MDVIPDSASINCIVVVPKYLKLIPFANDKLLYDGEQISWIIWRPVTNFARGMATSRVEVSERDEFAVWADSS